MSAKEESAKEHHYNNHLHDLAPHERQDESETFRKFAAIIRRLRAPDGCPWDRKQTLQSLRRYIVQESFELITAIQEGHNMNVAEELGDVFLVAMLIADALEEESGITLTDVLENNGEKLIRRHPHVFGEIDVSDSDEVVANWNIIKEQKEGRDTSPHTVSASLPPLERAQEIQKKASKLGFDWDNVTPAIAKVREELEELEVLIDEMSLRTDPKKGKDNPLVEKEIGDLLFSAVNVARHLHADVSVALDRTNTSFLSRFSHIEESLSQDGRSVHQTPLDELDALWDKAKSRE